MPEAKKRWRSPPARPERCFTPPPAGRRQPAYPPRAAEARCGRQGVSTDYAAAQASTLGWDRYVGDSGAVAGMHTFGASAPLRELLTKFGFTPGQVSQAARERVAAAGQVAGAAGKDST
jgi:pyruvate dehydrogenase complex dehydrogenase (E1) component